MSQPEAISGPSGTGKTFLLEALGRTAVENGQHVAWFTLESLGVLVRRHRADDSLTKAISRILRADLGIGRRHRPAARQPRRHLVRWYPDLDRTVRGWRSSAPG